MNRNPDTLPVRESTKSLQRFKTLPIEERVHIVSNDLLNNYKPSSRNRISRPSINKPKKSQEEMVGRIKLLETELQRKLNQDGVLRNFLKTLNSSDLSRIDIYLELRKCEQIIEPLQARLAQQSERSQTCLQRVQTLEELLQEKQKKYIENIVVLESQFDDSYRSRDKELSTLKNKMEDMKNQLENNKFLLAEVKKKNESLMQDNRTLAQQHKSNERKHQKASKQFESTKSELLSKIEELQLSHNSIVMQSEQVKMKNGVLVAKVEKHQRNRAQLNEKIMKLHDQSQLKNREISRYRQILDQKQSQIAELQRLVHKKQQHIISLNERLTDQLQKYTTHLHILEAQSKQFNLMNQQLSGQMKQLEKEKIAREQCSKGDRSMIRQLKERQQALIKYYENERQQMMVELKRQKFDDDETESLRKRYQLDQQEKESTIQRLQNKIGDFIKENHFLSKRVDEFQKELDRCKANQKLNQKIYAESYKIAGRLLEIKKQIMLVLNTEVVGDPQDAEDSLQKVVPSFLKTVYSLIIQCKNSGQKTEGMKRHLTQRIRQLCNLLHHFKNAVDIDSIDLLVQRYVGCLEPLGQMDCKNSEAISEAYHLIIQKLINGQRSKKFVTEPSINIVNDSLDNVIFKENHRESNDKPLFDKKYEQSIRLSHNSHASNAFSRSKESQSNKENTNCTNEVQRISKQKNSVYYNSIDRPTAPTQPNRKSSDRIRTEIQRKYFRS